MKKPAKTIVSVLVPAFNEEENVERAYAAIVDVFRSLPGYDYEIIVTDNHSTDRTFQILRQIAARDPKLRVIRFSRNYGYERSLLVIVTFKIRHITYRICWIFGDRETK
jgi:dolichol-phosphate mannosyltransferase